FLSASANSRFFFRPPQIPETRPRPSGVHGCCPLPKEGTQRLIGPNMGGFFFSLPFGPQAVQSGSGLLPGTAAGVWPDAMLALPKGRKSPPGYYADSILEFLPERH